MIINSLKVGKDSEEELQRILPGFPVSVYQTDFPGGIINGSTGTGMMISSYAV